MRDSGPTFDTILAELRAIAARPDIGPNARILLEDAIEALDGRLDAARRGLAGEEPKTT